MSEQNTTEQNWDKEIQLMQEVKEKAILEWRAFDIPTIDRILTLLQSVNSDDKV